MERHHRRADDQPRFGVISAAGYWLAGVLDGEPVWLPRRADAATYAGPDAAWRDVARFEPDIWRFGVPRVVNVDPADGFAAVIELCPSCARTGRVTDDRRGERYCLACSGYGVYAIWGLQVVQLHWGGLFDGRPHDGNLHLVRDALNGGCPGPLLCGFDFRARGHGQPGYSVGGGISGEGVDRSPCAGCVVEAQMLFPGLPVCGTVRGDTIAQVVGVPQVDSWLPRRGPEFDVIEARRRVARETRLARSVAL